MSLSLANATTEIRDLLNESSSSFWTDAQIQRWIKEGTRIFSSKSLMVEASANITLIANNLVYTSNEDAWIANCIEPYAAYYDDQSYNYKGLIKIHPKKIGNVGTFSPGAPKYYGFHKRSFYIWPLTTAAIVTAGGVITVLYSGETDDITAIEDEFQHIPILWATARCKQRDGKFAEANSLITQFYNELNFDRVDKHDREQDVLSDFKVQERGTGNARG